MKLFDIEKLAHSIVHPFQDVLTQFTEQMDVLHKEVKKTNKLLEEITMQNHTQGCMLERELTYLNQGVREHHVEQERP